MKSRMQVRAVRRSPLPITETDEFDLQQLRISAAFERALNELSGAKITAADVSEAALLHAVFEAGMTAIRHAAEEAGYAELAAQQAEDEPQRRAEARRRRPSWADEA